METELHSTRAELVGWIWKRVDIFHECKSLIITNQLQEGGGGKGVVSLPFHSHVSPLFDHCS